MNSVGTPRRLLVITFHFPPDGAVGGFRWSGLSKYLARRGWEIHVITAAAQNGQPGIPGVTVHHCRRLRTINDRYRDSAAQRRAKRVDSRSPGVAPETEAGRHEHWGDRVRRTLGTVLALPDQARGWILRAAAKAQELQSEMSFDALVSSGPPHSAHLAALLGSLGRHTPRVVDLRDPWSAIHETTGAQALNNSRWIWAVLMRLERLVFSRATRLIANTSEFAAVLRRTHPTRPVSFIPNGIDPERLPPSAPQFDTLTISYLGTLYLRRDLTPVIRALSDFISLHPETRESVKLRVAGFMDAEHAVRFWAEVDAAGLHDSVEVRGSIPNSEALDLINRSHLTLVLAQDQPKQIPAKLYECVSMRVPTLVIGESGSAATLEAARVGAMVCEPDDIAGIRSAIEQVWLHPGRTAPPAVSIGYEAIASQLDEVLRGIPEGRSYSVLAELPKA